MVPMFPFNPFYMYPQMPVLVPQPRLPPNEAAESTSTKKKYKRVWKRGEVKKLYEYAQKYSVQIQKKVEDFEFHDYQVLAHTFGQTPDQCMKKLLEIQANGTLRPGVWAEAEDEQLTLKIGQVGNRWGEIASHLNTVIHKGYKLRTGKQCKERWNNHLNPAINRSAWTKLEDINLLQKYKRFGNRWSKIAKKIADRTESAIKNRIKSLLNKEVQSLSGTSEDSLVDHLIMRYRMEVTEDAVQDDASAASPCSGRYIDPSPAPTSDVQVQQKPVEKTFAAFSSLAQSTPSTVVRFNKEDLIATEGSPADLFTPNFPGNKAGPSSFSEMVGHIKKVNLILFS